MNKTTEDLMHQGKQLRQEGKFEEAIATYQKVIELKPDNPNLYLNLAQLYLEKSNLDGLIDAYQKAIRLKPNLPFHIYQKLAEALNQQGRKDEATKVIKSAPQIDFKDGEAYLRIWNALNQTTLKTLDEESSHYPTEINQQAVEQYFTQSSQYKIIHLTSLTEEDQRFIENLGLSLTYLKLNKAGLITKEGVSQEKSISHSAEFRKTQWLNLPLKVAKAFERSKFQLSMVEEGCIYAVCPSTGQILSSNRSLVPSANGYIFYRFVGKEIFYLITGRVGAAFPKLCLYFPIKELIVDFLSLPRGQKQTFARFKTYVVTNWQRLESYLLSKSQAKTVALVSNNHFAHHLWNELSGIYKLYKTDSLDKVDKFLLISEPLGCIDEIFPEISAEKIKRIESSEIIAEILDNSYFVLRLGWNFIKEDLADRIYQTSLKHCSSAFLAEVESVKKKYFPLIWITIRLNNRTWVSQIEGIANIIQSFSANFPNLGVVIDGFSLPYGVLLSPSVEETIRKEKETVRKIQSFLSPEIKVYDLVGCMLYESIVWANAIDFYIAHHGTIQHKIGWTANKPGVVHTNTQVLETKVSGFKNQTSWARENGVLPVYISSHYINDVTENVKKDLNDKRRDLINYDCDWRVIYEEALKLANSLKDKRSEVGLKAGNQFGKEAKITKALDAASSTSMSNNLVIVIGRGNSGTRILSYTLYASGIYMGNRLNAAGDKVPATPIYDACKILANYVKWKGQLSWDFSRLFTAEIPNDFKQLVDEYIADIFKRPKNQIMAGWKLPETTLIYPWIVRLFPNAKYIHWLRDPRDCVITQHLTDELENLGIEYPSTDFIRKKRAISWYYQYELIRATPQPKHLLLVRYEDFVLKQEETLARLEEFLEVPLARVILRKDSIGRWKTDKGKHFFPFFKPALIENGYELSPSN